MSASQTRLKVICKRQSESEERNCSKKIVNIYVYQIITLCTLNMYNYVCQVFLNKIGEKRGGKELIKRSKGHEDNGEELGKPSEI